MSKKIVGAKACVTPKVKRVAASNEAKVTKKSK
jgi:hypothetical protein